jgi:ribonucleoside-triphosphate reductase
MTDLGLDALSKLTVFSKYAKYVPELKRRETWDEIVDRYENMMVKKYPKLEDAIKKSAELIRAKKVLPSMRALQFAGPAAEVNNSRIYNCCYLPIDSIHSFSETMFLLLGGTGVGYSVQKQHVAQLPTITKPGKTRNYLIEDSIMGWADAVKVLMKAYLEGGFMPKFDFRAIRKKGARLITAGGKAPGPEPLKICLAHVQAILERKEQGQSLSPLECHDILCHIANSVLAGGIRRSAMIALFSHDDEEMITCKYGNWWETNEQRGRANNSAVLLRGSVGEEEFKALWKRIEASGSGEPGIYWTNDLDWGTNPCCEIALRPYQFCNLCEVNVSDVENQLDLNDRVSVAAFFGTLQAGFTDFHYLRPIWQKTTQKDALLGIGMTGIGSGEILKYNLELAANTAKVVNSMISEKIGTNEAARITCIKPSGTTSLVLGTASGIHAWHAPYYLRTMRFGKTEDIASYLIVNHPELVEDDVLRPHVYAFL